MNSSVDGDGERGSLRNLESQTTIPLGHVDPSELEGAMDLKYNQPLFRCLFDGRTEKEIDIDQLLAPIGHWLDVRLDKGDISTVDPSLKEALEKAVKLKDLASEKEVLLNEKEREYNKSLMKINATADAMISQQREKVLKMGSSNVDESPLFKVNKNNVVVWKGHKIQLLDKAFQCVRDESTIADSDFKDHLYAMIEMAYATWMDHAQNDPDAGVDPELLGELEAIMESSPRVT